ncbi:Nucleotide-sensitive chloride conductance regulator (ICln) protein [Cardiosporidium cionae]|uniref:Nucleotide-sensitive chloride conductance regulator (ICln) protein n=1 Tax=Cardiosporidium cionae TaxID=476202 RepID=A0ABQ7JBG9_9APIC|nr:Nucleotide-sensitive chloride conductance regulator (ICln) protein [Cardiosporidium cionae]|eukprot:KAF8821005.1 Nucleotide-sensitive chloride conductance regulator (ICln) protein [Cardiosporidium cionae]
MPIQQFSSRSPSGEPQLEEEFEETIALSEPQTVLQLFSKDEGTGTLYLTSRRVIWLSSQDLDKGYAMDYPFIVLHAISRDPATFEHPCIYCQLREGINGEINEDFEEEEVPIPEMRFIPVDSSKLQRIFDVFSELAADNPDPDFECSEDDEDLDNSVYWEPQPAMDGEMNDADEAAKLN